MVLFTLVDLTLDIGIWVVKTSVSMGYYLLWGTPETPEYKNSQLILQEIKKLKEENELLISEVGHLRDQHLLEHTFEPKCALEHTLEQSSNTH